MAHVILRRQAIELRKLGKSYSQIKNLLGIPKSTLSDWLKKYPLSKEQIHLLRDVSEVRIEHYRETMQRKKEARLLNYYNEAKSTIIPLSERELLIAGIFLYWGEGTKSGEQLVVANTDPKLVQFALLWMLKALKIPKEEIHVLVHLYKDMDTEEALNYWSNILEIPRKQFSPPYIKDSLRSQIDYKGYGHGTCNLRVYKKVVKEKVMMALKCVADYSSDYFIGV